MQREARRLVSRAGSVVTGSAVCDTDPVLCPTAIYQVQLLADGLKCLRSFCLYYGPQRVRVTVRWHWPWAWHSSRLLTHTNSVSIITPLAWNCCLLWMRRQRLRELKEFPTSRGNCEGRAGIRVLESGSRVRVYRLGRPSKNTALRAIGRSK